MSEYFSNRAFSQSSMLHKCQDQLDKLKKLTDDLGWDYDRMSSSGQETLDEIYKVLEMETMAELDELAEKEMKNERNK